MPQLCELVYAGDIERMKLKTYKNEWNRMIRTRRFSLGIEFQNPKTYTIMKCQQDPPTKILLDIVNHPQ